ncbi:MAG: hypothetical protein CMO55_25030 [Verrucomicrobiales bacterium]|nr:hypothetical protein [Verrucomicrobiales bacterium]
MSYEYDIFLSYCGKDEACEWVRRHFHPMLSGKLGQEMPDAPRIFIDREMENGVRWRNTILRALRHSRILLAIWNPAYFRSEWCQAEWQTILERERAENVPGHEPGYLYSVIYGDGEYFPDEAAARQDTKFHEHAYSSAAYAESKEYIEFEKAVTQVAKKIAARLMTVPEWRDDWPTMDPDTVQMKEMKRVTKIPSL